MNLALTHKKTKIPIRFNHPPPLRYEWLNTFVLVDPKVSKVMPLIVEIRDPLINAYFFRPLS